MREKDKMASRMILKQHAHGKTQRGRPTATYLNWQVCRSTDGRPKVGNGRPRDSEKDRRSHKYPHSIFYIFMMTNAAKWISRSGTIKFYCIVLYCIVLYNIRPQWLTRVSAWVILCTHGRVILPGSSCGGVVFVVSPNCNPGWVVVPVSLATSSFWSL